MPEIKFLPKGQTVTVEDNTKILVAARRAKIDIRFGCAACRCGTCGIRILSGENNLTPMATDEKALLERMGLDIRGSIRLACRARLVGNSAVVDLDFQDTYSPGFDLDP